MDSFYLGALVSLLVLIVSILVSGLDASTKRQEYRYFGILASMLLGMGIVEFTSLTWLGYPIFFSALAVGLFLLWRWDRTKRAASQDNE